MSEVHPIPSSPKFKNLTGRAFGDWSVLSYAGKIGKSANITAWNCRCVCATEKVVASRSLCNGSSTSCGCRHTRNLQGVTFGELVVISFAKSVSGKGIYWNCLCSCGEKCVKRGDDMVAGATKSCGNLRRLRFWVHGECWSAEYKAWLALRTRCYNPKSARYKSYGARGIRVCGLWRNSFAEFLQDVGKKPSRQHSIDRIDNDLGYFCGHCDDCRLSGISSCNCKWSTKAEQDRNKQGNVWMTARGKTMILADWAKETGQNDSLIRSRRKRGWSDEKAIFTFVPVKNSSSQSTQELKAE